MSKFQLQNLLGENLGEGYARKEAAIKAAATANLAEGEYVVLDPNGVQVHPAPEGDAPAEDKSSKVQKPPAKGKTTKTAKEAKPKPEAPKPKDLGNGFTSTQRGKQVIVRNADGHIVAQATATHAADVKAGLRARPTGPLKMATAKVKNRLKTEGGETVARIWNEGYDDNVKALVKALG